jgi:hypothetical protein
VHVSTAPPRPSVLAVSRHETLHCGISMVNRGPRIRVVNVGLMGVRGGAG